MNNNLPRAVQLLAPTVCEGYSVHDIKHSTSARKRRGTLPAVRKQTTAAFLVALADGDVKTAQLLLDSSLSTLATDRLGRTALHLATCLPPSNSSNQICQVLLEKMWDVNKGDLFGMSPFFYAVSSQNLAMVSAMLAAAKADKCDKFGNTALHHATATGNAFTVTAISKVTKKINKVNILGFTPLMIASKLGHVDCAKILTLYGAVSGSIRDMHCYLTAAEWARFSDRFTDSDLRELKLAETHFKRQAQTPSLLRSVHPDCRTGTNEVYRTTSRTLPISVGNDHDQTQLMIKRVILLRKLSEFFNSAGKRLQVRGHVYESKLEVREKCSGNIKSISVNDLLDQHLSKLTLGGMRSTASARRQKKKKSVLKAQKTETPLDSGSDDSMLIRQAQEIEKGNILRKKQQRRPAGQVESAPKRSPLEPSIVTLVHGSPPGPPVPTPRSSANSGEQSPRVLLNVEPREVFSPDRLAEQEVLIPDCTTVDSLFVRQQPVSDDTPARAYQRDKKQHHPPPPAPFLCEKVGLDNGEVRYGYSRPRTHCTAARVGENPSSRSRTPILPQYTLSKRKKKRPKSKSSDPMKGFGPWIAEPDRSSNQTFINTISMVPQIKVDFR